MTRPRVVVRKLTHGRWAVECRQCDREPMFTLPWAVAADHPTAVTLANFHVNLHRRRSWRLIPYLY